MEGWTIFRNGVPNGSVHKTMKSLLIGFDLIPLRGLKKCRKDLIEKGMPPTKVKVVVSDRMDYHYWCPTYKGRFYADMLEWSTLKESKFRCFRSLCYYLCSQDGRAGRKGLFYKIFADEERKTLHRIEELMTLKRYKDKRRRNTWRRVAVSALSLLKDKGFRIVTVKIVPLS